MGLEPAQSEKVKRLEQEYQRLTRTQSYNEVEELMTFNKREASNINASAKECTKHENNMAEGSSRMDESILLQQPNI